MMSWFVVGTVVVGLKPGTGYARRDLPFGPWTFGSGVKLVGYSIRVPSDEIGIVQVLAEYEREFVTLEINVVGPEVFHVRHGALHGAPDVAFPAIDVANKKVEAWLHIPARYEADRMIPVDLVLRLEGGQ